MDTEVTETGDEAFRAETPPCLIRAQVDVDPTIPRSPRQITELVDTIARLTLEHPGVGHLMGMVSSEAPDHYADFIEALPIRHPARGRWDVPTDEEAAIHHMASHPYPGTGQLPWRDATISTEDFHLPAYAEELLPTEVVERVAHTVATAPDDPDFELESEDAQSFIRAMQTFDYRRGAALAFLLASCQRAHRFPVGGLPSYPDPMGTKAQSQGGLPIPSTEVQEDLATHRTTVSAWH